MPRPRKQRVDGVLETPPPPAPPPPPPVTATVAGSTPKSKRAPIRQSIITTRRGAARAKQQIENDVTTLILPEIKAPIEQEAPESTDQTPLPIPSSTIPMTTKREKPAKKIIPPRTISTRKSRRRTQNQEADEENQSKVIQSNGEDESNGQKFVDENTVVHDQAMECADDDSSSTDVIKVIEIVDDSQSMDDNEDYSLVYVEQNDENSQESEMENSTQHSQNSQQDTEEDSEQEEYLVCEISQDVVCQTDEIVETEIIVEEIVETVVVEDENVRNDNVSSELDTADEIYESSEEEKVETAIESNARNQQERFVVENQTISPKQDEKEITNFVSNSNEMEDSIKISNDLNDLTTTKADDKIEEKTDQPTEMEIDEVAPPPSLPPLPPPPPPLPPSPTHNFKSLEVLDNIEQEKKTEKDVLRENTSKVEDITAKVKSVTNENNNRMNSIQDDQVILEKLQDIKIDDAQLPLTEDIKLIAPPPQVSPHNLYAEAFAGLSNETKSHIFEALMRSKAEMQTTKKQDGHKTTKSKKVKEPHAKKPKKSSKRSRKDKDRGKKKDKHKTVKDENNEEELSVRRSSRIQTISQTRQRSHGHGLVRDRRDKDRMSKGDGFDDSVLTSEGEDRSTTSRDSSRSGCAAFEPAERVKTQEEIEAEIAHDKDVQRRLSNFVTIRDNIYHCEKNISKEAKNMTCDCFLTKEEFDRGELGCGEDCLNRLLMIECSSKCTVGERCTNLRFQKTQYAGCKVFRTEKKGFGIMATENIPPGEFIMEYVGEVLNSEQFERRADEYSKDKNIHYYFMSLRSDAVIDATTKGNISRFINHSCDPNAETQKWTVNGELRIGFFSIRTIMKGEEITFDYQFQRYGKEAQKCYCEAENCRGWIGEEPESDEEEEEEDEEEIEETAQLKVVETKDDLETSVKIESIPTPLTIESGTILGDVESNELSTSVPLPVPPPPPMEIIEKPQIVKVRKVRQSKKKARADIFDDADVDDEIDMLSRTGLKNQVHTLKLSRLMVRAKLPHARLRVLDLLQNGELPCRRLFLDYHGLRLLGGWMSETLSQITLDALKFQLVILDTLKLLPIPNKTMLKESKVFSIVEHLSQGKNIKVESPNDETPSDSGSTTPLLPSESPNQLAALKSCTTKTVENSPNTEDELNFVKISIRSLSLKLISNWESLPEVFRIPKKERIEQMKEHEREADLRYKSLGLSVAEEPEKSKYDRYRERKRERTIIDQNKREKKTKWDTMANIDKHQRRQMFEMQFAKAQQEKKEQEFWRQHEMKCQCFGLDPRQITPDDIPTMVNPVTGQWYTLKHRPVATPPSHAHIKPSGQTYSTDPDDYHLPKQELPAFWKCGIDTRGRIYYYHTKIRLAQWEPPIFLPPLALTEINTEPEAAPVKISPEDAEHENDSSSTDSCDSSEEEMNDRMTALKNKFKQMGQQLPKVNITEQELADAVAETKRKLIEAAAAAEDPDTLTRMDTGKALVNRKRKRKRREGLVSERIISPRTEEDKIYGRMQSKLCRETKEKLRRRKEEMRKRRLIMDLDPSGKKIMKLTEGLPRAISPYDSDESDDDLIASSLAATQPPIDPDNPTEYVESLITHSMISDDKLLMEIKTVTAKKNVYDEWKKQQAKLKADAAKKREAAKVLALSGASMKSKRKSETSRSSSSSFSSGGSIQTSNLSTSTDAVSSDQAKRIKEKFKTDIAGVIVQHLTPYRKDSCRIGRITDDEDFKHLAKKLTYFVMLKELKHCDNTVDMLEVTESVKIKAREFIKKYMSKFGSIYQRNENEPDFKC